MITPNGAAIQSILFGPNQVEISFSEPRDIEAAEQHGILNVRTKSVPIGVIEKELPDLGEAIDDLLNRVARAERT